MATSLAVKDLSELIRLCPILKRFPVQRMNLRYDEEADVVYVKFDETEPIHTSVLTDDGILIEYDSAHNIVGLTILDASQR